MYYDFDSMETAFLKAYALYSNIEKMTCILTMGLNQELHELNFNPHVHVMLVEVIKNTLRFYWLEQEMHTKEMTVSNLDTTDDERLIRIIKARLEVLRAEAVIDEKWNLFADIKYFDEIEKNKVFYIPIADWKGYPICSLWQHVCDVFIDNWQWICSYKDHIELLECPSPSIALTKADYYWAPRAVGCCRVMEEGGFYAGHGDPYESSMLFHAVYNVAASFYEKRESSGIIVPLSEKDKPAIVFRNPVEFDARNNRILRKMLELTRFGLALALSEQMVVGLADPLKYKSQIIITGKNQWKYCKNGETVFSVNNSEVNVNTPPAEIEKYIPDEKKKDLPNIDIIESIARSASNQTHGTTIVFTTKAEKESQRLSLFNRCEQIEPVELTGNDNFILSLTSIDGALIADFDGKCYGIGAILDGEAVKAGKLGRGARFNSAQNYVAWQKKKNPDDLFCVIIISEDGIIDVLSTSIIDNEDDEFN